MEKKFKCKDEVIYRGISDNDWIFGLFSHYGKNEYGVEYIVVNGRFYRLDEVDILPYEGNEHLVGTSDEPDEEVRMEEGEWVMLSDYADCSPSNWQLRIYSTVGEKIFHVFCDSEFDNKKRISLVGWAFAIRFSDFNPNDMEETRRHILCVKNGKIIKYRKSND